MVDGLNNERNTPQADRSRQPSPPNAPKRRCCWAGDEAARGPNDPVDRSARDEHRCERLPQQRVDRLGGRACAASSAARCGCAPCRISQHVAARCRIGHVDEARRHEWAERLAHLIGIA
eukprot:CAMPEP_0181208384 /NCGR_PEP_ID=MMETSP1096-20121128/22090_1 /TAXON_ID=156174 ORGANISM="Chrysochromulina ericina, Strain CCMP281" /NCGR_SAMPLE_ID=MMETSP1096 /ASSEMBLY_ACC=CAM_ASM_000453 /LENGTH=118 /DNA_ID=CAMNT_0023299447 /DNA_START=336 /DNA_END=692 /DNA_ORIENTATION=-